MPRYQLLVDGAGRDKVTGDDEVRAWLARYREEHGEDDPDAAHVQVRKLGPLAWLTGGTLVPRERFR